MISLEYKFKIKYSKDFREEFDNFLINYQCFYHINLNSRRFYIKLKKIINIIQDFPEIFPIVKIKNNLVRKIVIGKYIILYQINYNQKEILFLHIFYYRQNYLNL